MDKEKTIQPDTCKEKTSCELFESGQCEGHAPCPKADSPR